MGNASKAAAWSAGISGSVSAVAAIWSLGQANNAKNNAAGLKNDLLRLEENRQKIINPYTNISNPYENLSVATGAAEMQAEQTDIALANTLDIVRQSGAGGATALAQAALEGKKGIAADIQKQEASNQKLRAKGAMTVQKLKAEGDKWEWEKREERQLQKLDRTQAEIDQERANEMAYRSAGVGALTDLASNAAAFGGLMAKQGADGGDGGDGE